MNIALLDNGIFCKGTLRNSITERKVFLSKEILERAEEKFVPVHGTKCAEIIKDICPEVCFLDLRILYHEGTTELPVLLEALDWCIQNEIKLIHMSLGTVSYFDINPLEIRIKKLISQGTIIVAAYHNRNIRTYPAAFSGVFGVRQDRYGILSSNQFMFQEQQGGNRENSIVAQGKEMDRKKQANSYAAPVVTGYIARFLNQHPDAEFQEVLTYLDECSVHGKVYPDRLGNTVRKGDIEIPVIAGIGLYDREISWLSRQFEEKGYQVLLLQECLTDSSAIPIEYYSGKDISLANILYTVNWIYEPNIIFLDFISYQRQDRLKFPEIDIFIFYEDKTYKLYGDKLIGVTRELEEIYDIICRYYE